MNRTLVDLECIAASKEYELPMSAVAFGILKKFDLPDLCANLAPRPLWLVNTLGAQGKGIALSDVRERYGKALQAYVNAKQTENFAIRVQPGSMDGTVAEWLKKAVL
jgi:hypothetical protein